MKSRHVLITSFSGSYGGMEIRMLQEAEILIKQGCRVTILVNQFYGVESMKSAAPVGAKFIVASVPYFLEYWRLRFVRKLLAKIFYRSFFAYHKPDLVHVFFCWTTYGLTHMWGAGKCGIPTVASVHNVFKREPLTDYVVAHLKECFSTLESCYAVSDSARIAFSEIYPNVSNRIQTIHNWVDLDRFHPSESDRARVRKELGIPEHTTVIGCVARLSEQKNHFYLLETFKRLKQARDNLLLLIVGSGDRKQEIMHYIEQNGLTNDVRMLEFQDEVQRYYRAIDIHALLSKREGFGISTIEAMASGCLCCVTDIPGSNDVINSQEIGVRVGVDDCQAVADRLDELLGDAELMRSIKVNSLNTVRLRYDKNLVTQKLLKFYNQLRTSGVV